MRSLPFKFILNIRLQEKIRLEIPGGHVDFTISSDVFDIPPCFAVSTPLQPTTNRPNEKKFRKFKKI